MPSVVAPAKVLVTGASGFLATHVVRTLLEEGYTVVGTVRSPPKGDYLVNLFKSSKFSYVVVEDIEKSDAFDEVVKAGNFDAIEHTASPFHMHADDPKELIGPAVEGTLNILRSALNFGSTVKRVVITSSSTAVLEPKPTPYTYSEADWNEASIRVVDELGSKASNDDKYSASKTLAERAAWSFIEENKANIGFDLSVINPSYIFGPIIHEVKDVDALNTSHAMFHAAILAKDEDLTPETTGEYCGNLVDVRTAATAHVLALKKEEAGGKRFLTSTAPFSWQDIYDALNKAGVEGVPKGHPGSQQRKTYNYQDNAQSRRVLGLEFIGLEQLAVDTLSSLKERFPGSL